MPVSGASVPSAFAVAGHVTGSYGSRPVITARGPAQMREKSSPPIISSRLAMTPKAMSASRQSPVVTTKAMSARRAEDAVTYPIEALAPSRSTRLAVADDLAEAPCPRDHLALVFASHWTAREERIGPLLSPRK